MKAACIASLLIVGAVVSTGCNSEFGSGGDEQSFCGAALDYGRAAQDGRNVSGDSPLERYNELQQVLDRLGAALDQMERTAPENVAAALADFRAFDHDTLSVSEREAYSRSARLVDRYILSACDLAVTL